MNNRTKRKLIKNSILIYDSNSAPGGIDLNELLDIFYKHGIIVFDSSKGGEIPSIIPKRNIKAITFEDRCKKD